MFFAAPLVYFVGGVFLALAGYYFYTNLNAFITFGFGESIVEHLWQRLFNDVVRIVITVIPLITMRVYAEEKNLGTIELLYTAPLRDWEILASKYLACLGVVVVLIGSTALYPYLVYRIQPFDTSQLVAVYLGVFLLIAAMVAIGVFVSSLTETQLIAAMFTYGIVLLLWNLSWNEAAVPNSWLGVVSQVCAYDHFEPFSRGVIDLRDVVKDYSTGAGSFRALAGITLQVEPGELVAVVGKSGCGKSTLLNMITGIDRPSGGQITVAGLNLRRASENELARWRGRHIGLVFQFFQLIPTLTVAENVMLPMDFAGRGSPRDRQARAAELLELVEMTDQADKLPLATSGGQQQRIAIARALANDPQVLVADEPTGNLDSATSGQVVALFARLAGAGRTVVLVTHDAELAAQAGRVVRMADGRIVDGLDG